MGAQVILLDLLCGGSYVSTEKYPKIPKNSDTRKIAVIILKFDNLP